MSAVTDYEYCFFCGNEPHGVHHLIFGSASRKLADEDGLFIPICDACHTMGKTGDKIHGNSKAEALSKALGQAIYERNECAKGMTLDEARDSFRRRYGGNYL